MSFEPVELTNPATGRKHTAQTPVDLNDRVNEGYRRVEITERAERVEPPVVLSPAPRVYDFDSADYSYPAE